MSAQLKTFMDRFTDLLCTEKALGTKLKGKNCYFISSSHSYKARRAFHTSFQRFANYLGMHYKGARSIRTKTPEAPFPYATVEKEIVRFTRRVKSAL